MRTEQIYYFLETVKTGSFTKAAANLHLQQPSLRESLTNLENELGHTLFIRTKKGVELTEYGNHILPHLQNMYQTYLDLKAGKISASPVKQFVIAAQSAFDYQLPTLYNLLSHEFSDTTLKINYIDDCDQLLNSVVRGLADIGLISNVCDYLGENAFYQAQVGQTFEVYTFYEGELAMIVSPTHPLAQKDCLTYQDLRNQTLVFTNMGAPTLSFLRKHTDLKHCEIMNVFNHKLAENYCLNQNYITFLPLEFCTNTALVSKRFCEPMPIDFRLVYRYGHMNDRIIACLNYLKSMLYMDVYPPPPEKFVIQIIKSIIASPAQDNVLALVMFFYCLQRRNL